MLDSLIDFFWFFILLLAFYSSRMGGRGDRAFHMQSLFVRRLRYEKKVPYPTTQVYQKNPTVVRLDRPSPDTRWFSPGDDT